MASMPNEINVQVTFDEESLALLREIRDLLKAQNQPLKYTYNPGIPHRLVEERVQAVNAEPMDNTNLWGTR